MTHILTNLSEERLIIDAVCMQNTLAVQLQSACLQLRGWCFHQGAIWRMSSAPPDLNRGDALPLASSSASGWKSWWAGGTGMADSPTCHMLTAMGS